MRLQVLLAIGTLTVAGPALADPATAASDAAHNAGHDIARAGRATGHTIANGAREVGHAAAVTSRRTVRGVRHALHIHHHHRYHHHGA